MPKYRWYLYEGEKELCTDLLGYIDDSLESEKPMQEGLEEEIREYMSNEAYRREAFINGHEAAEKDIALTWEDIALIDDLLCEVPSMNKEEYYTEVLTRFKRFKEGKK